MNAQKLKEKFLNGPGALLAYIVITFAAIKVGHLLSSFMR